MTHAKSIAVFLVLLSVGAQASNPLFDAFGVGKALGDKLGGNYSHQANEALNQAVTAAAGKVNSTVAPIRGHVHSALAGVNGTLKPVTDHLEKNVLTPVRGIVKSVHDGVQSKVDQAVKLLPTDVGSWKAAVALAWLKESGLYDKLNSTFPADGFKVPDIPAEIQKAQLQKLALLGQLNSTLSTAQGLKNSLVLSLLKESHALDALALVQNKTGLQVTSLLPTAGPGAGLPHLPKIPLVPELKVNFTLPTLPTLPKFHKPELKVPNFTLPTLPSLPKFHKPEFKVPNLTLPSLPSLPKFHKPELKVPNLTLPSLPSLPKFHKPELKAIPNITLPALPTIPDLPSLAHKVPPLTVPNLTLPTIPKIPTLAIPAKPDLPSLASIKALLPNFTAESLLGTLPFGQLTGLGNLTGKAPSLANDQLAALAKRLGIRGVSTPAGLTDLKQAIALSLLKDLPHGAVATALFSNATQAISDAHAQLAKQLASRLSSANEALTGLLKHFSALKAVPEKAVNETLAQATKQAQDLLDSKVKQAAAAIDAANKQAQQLAAAHNAIVADPQAAVQGVIGNLTAQLESGVKAATEAINAAQKQAASVIDSKLATVGLGGLAANASQALEAHLKAANDAVSNITLVASELKANPIKAVNEALSKAHKQAQDLLDSKVKQANAAIALANRTADQLFASRLAAANGAQNVAESLIANLTKKVESTVKSANDAVYAAQKQAAAVIDSKLAALGLPGVAGNATEKLQAQILSIGQAYQNLTKCVADLKANPTKTANKALSAAQAQAQQLADVHNAIAADPKKAASAVLALAGNQTSAVLDQAVAAFSQAYWDVLKHAQSIVAYQIQVVAGAQTGAANVLAQLNQQYEAKSKNATDALAAARKELNTFLDSKLAAVGLGGLAANTSALIDTKLKNATDALAAVAAQAQAAHAALQAAKANPISAASTALGNATSRAQYALDLHVAAANGLIDQANNLTNLLLSAKTKAATSAADQARKLAPDVASLAKQLDAKLKQANSTLAAAQKQLATLKKALPTLALPSLGDLKAKLPFNHTVPSLPSLDSLKAKIPSIPSIPIPAKFNHSIPSLPSLPSLKAKLPFNHTGH